MKDVQVKRVEVGIMPTNCYIIKPGESRDAIVIDPGDELTVIQDALHRMDAVCRLILLTHGHFDHILAVGDLRGSKVPVAIHERDAEMLTERDMFSSMIKYDPRPFEPAEFTFKRRAPTPPQGWNLRYPHARAHPGKRLLYLRRNDVYR